VVAVSYLASDETFCRNAVALLEGYTGLPRSWFRGRRVLDAGCGNGRWSRALASCGADVTAVDASAAGVAHAREGCRDFPNVRVRRHDLLEPLDEPEALDLVFSFGVVHHTGNTRLAVEHLAACVKPGGYLFLMVYGEPRPGHVEDYAELNRYVELRRRLAGLDFDQKVAVLRRETSAADVHGWFDAASPRVNDLHRLDELAAWIRPLGFGPPRTTTPSRNLHVIAQRA
jgi:SAM-dependent methyltransferase